MTAISPAIRGGHTVQFYGNEGTLHRAVETFLTEGARMGGPLVMVARRRTFDAVAGRLAHRILFVDAEAALAQFMDGSTLDPAALSRSFQGLLASIDETGVAGTIWIYGEMSDLLCEQHTHQAAVELEECWNRLTADCRPIVTLCGYAVDHFGGDAQAGTLQAICRQHTHVVPAEGAPAAPALYIIDDDPSVRRSLARLLASVDLDVRTFASAEDFLSEVDESSSGCLILDIQLLGMSGMDLQRRLARARGRWPIIAMSGAYDARIEEEAVRLGAVVFLRKPFPAQSLLDAIARARATL